MPIAKQSRGVQSKKRSTFRKRAACTLELYVTVIRTRPIVTQMRLHPDFIHRRARHRWSSLQVLYLLGVPPTALGAALDVSIGDSFL